MLRDFKDKFRFSIAAYLKNKSNIFLFWKGRVVLY